MKNNCYKKLKLWKKRCKSWKQRSLIVLNYASELENVSIKGLMGMATNTNNNNLIDKEFKLLNTEFKKYKSKDFDVLSMGMSNDYKLAISNESNMIRLGSIIFGRRK